MAEKIFVLQNPPDQLSTCSLSMPHRQTVFGWLLFSPHKISFLKELYRFPLFPAISLQIPV